MYRQRIDDSSRYENMIKAPDGFDENRYLAYHPDVRAAVQSGVFSSGFEHFLKYGLAEGRRFMHSVEDVDYSLMHPRPPSIGHLPFAIWNARCGRGQ